MAKKLTLILVLVMALAAVGLFAAGTKEQGGSSTAARPEFTYEKLRVMAEAGKYDGAPAKGHKICFANIIEGVPFTVSVREGIMKNWLAAGGSEKDVLLLDNNWDSATAIKVADLALNAKPEVFIQFQIDQKVNEMVSRKAKDAGVYMLAVDIPATGFPFMGVDNYGSARLAGKFIVDNVKQKFGGFDAVDKVFIGYDVGLGDYVNLRSYGIVDVLKETYGDIADPTKPGSKVIMVDQKNTTETMQKAMAEQLSKYPEAKNIIMTTQNDIGMAGVIAAAEIANRWDPKHWMTVSVNVDALGQQLIREGKIDGDVAYFPEKYGNYLVPAALAHIYGNPIPAYMLMDHLVVTKANIDTYYPVKK